MVLGGLKAENPTNKHKVSILDRRFVAWNMDM